MKFQLKYDFKISGVELNHAFQVIAAVATGHGHCAKINCFLFIPLCFTIWWIL